MPQLIYHIVVTVHEGPETAYAVAGAGWASLSCFFQPSETPGAQEGLEGSSAFTGEVMAAEKRTLSSFLWHFLATLVLALHKIGVVTDVTILRQKPCSKRTQVNSQ